MPAQPVCRHMRILTASALIILLLAAPASAAPAPLAQPRTAAGAVATEALWVAALKRRDTATLSRLLADGFVETTWQGARRGKPAVLAALPANGPQPIELSDLSAGLDGDTAVVRGLNTVRGPGGAVRAHIRFTDVFVYRGGAWRALAAQETLEQPS